MTVSSLNRLTRTFFETLEYLLLSTTDVQNIESMPANIYLLFMICSIQKYGMLEFNPKVQR